MQNKVRKALVATIAAASALASPITTTAQTGFGQSFVAQSSSHTLLTSLSLTGLEGLTYGQNPFYAQIYRISGGSIVGGSLFSQSLGTSFSNGFSIAPNLNLNVGDLYVVMATAPADYSSRGARFDIDFYAGGGSLSCSNGACEPAQTGVESDVNGFAMQFAQITVTPEPRTWVLMLVGLLAVGVSSRRKKQQV